MTFGNRPPHVVLVGLPGSGKTTVGRALGQELRRPFLDFDEEIERREGRTVREIFSDDGAAYFRALELRLTEEMRAAGGGMVLAPGGGWVTIPGAVERLRPPAAVIYLAVTPAEALSRMGPLLNARPLLAGDSPLQAIERLAVERAHIYERVADHVIDTQDLDVQGVTSAIVSRTSLFRGTSIKPAG